MTLHLTIDQARATAREIYLAGGLSAQGPTPECAYVDKSGLPCVIGACFPPEDRADLSGSVGQLVDHGYLDTDDEEGLLRLQLAHDEWARAGAQFRREIGL